MAGAPESAVERVRLSRLRPFVSVLVLQIQHQASPAGVFEQLTERAVRRRQSPGTEVTVLAKGLDEASLARVGVSFDEAAAVVWRRRRLAAWAVEGSPYVDEQHELMVCLRRGSLVAVHGPDTVRNSIEAWIDKKPPRPPIGRVRPGVLNAAFLAEGEAKTMWMKNVRGSSAARPSAKTLSGTDVVSTLDPIGDASFALGAARVAIPDDETRLVFTGTIGTTPQQSRIWSRAALDANEFLVAVDEALQLIQAVIDSGTELVNPYELLSSRLDSLEGVHGGFEFRCPLSAELSQDATPEQVLAAQELETVVIDAQGAADGPDVILNVGYEGSFAGRLRVAVTMDAPPVRLAIGHDGEGTDPPTVARIRQLLHQVGGQSIHYMSGHAVWDGGVYQVRRETAAFTGWDFRDMTGYQVNQEKPGFRSPQDIHAAIGEGGDRSLFTWVANTYTDGVLLCDDGTGEIADFLHIADNGTLSLIHVKAAGSASALRRIAVAHYEVVVGQAVKNLANLDPERLAQRLSDSPMQDPAAWSYGTRVTGRHDFLESLALRELADPVKVVVVQPHVTQTRHRMLRSMEADSPDPDVHRLRLLDTLLNTARFACIGSNADLIVIGQG